MSPNVVLYMDPGCPHCQQAERYLDSHGVQYQARDVTRDQAARADLDRMHAPGVPVIVVDGDAVIGFDKIRLDDLLKSKGIKVGEPA